MTLEQCLNARNYRDPHYKQHFSSFVDDNFNLKDIFDDESKAICDEVFDRAKQLFFGMD